MHAVINSHKQFIQHELVLKKMWETTSYDTLCAQNLNNARDFIFVC